MKTLYSLILISLMAFLMFSGASLVMSKALSNGNLDEESLIIITKYDAQLTEFQNNITVLSSGDDRIDPDFQPDNNNLDEFFKEYAEHKSRIDQLRDGVKLIYKLPEIMIIAIPFVTLSDLGNYLIVIWLMIAIIFTVAIIKALRSGQIDE